MKQEPHQQIEHRGHIINIYHDENPESPREWDNLGTMYTSHRRYRPEEELAKYFETEDVFESYGVFRDDFLRRYVALPVYLYDHSGLTVSTGPFSCPWDSGLFGIIAVPVEQVKKEYGWKNLTSKRRKIIEHRLNGEVETYDHFLTGEVYGVEVTPKGDDENIVYECWGYYGHYNLKHIEEECKHFIDEIHRKEAIQRVVNYWKYAAQLCLPFPEYQLIPLLNVTKA